MKILELILRIVLKLIEALSGKPSQVPPQIDQAGTTSDGTFQSTQFANPLGQQKSVTVYNDEVNALLSQVMEANRTRQEADMNEIIRLRCEISRLQEELILVKANVQGKVNMKQSVSEPAKSNDKCEPPDIGSGT